MFWPRKFLYGINHDQLYSATELCVYCCPKARKQILQIHTRHWQPKLSCDFLQELAEKCVGEYHYYLLDFVCARACVHITSPDKRTPYSY